MQKKTCLSKSDVLNHRLDKTMSHNSLYIEILPKNIMGLTQIVFFCVDMVTGKNAAIIVFFFNNNQVDGILQ